MYIGHTTKSIHERFRQHKIEARYNATTHLHKAINCYGEDNFNIEQVYEVLNEDDWQEKEMYFIKLYDTYNSGYNLTIGGEDPPIMYGDDNNQARLTKEQFNEIINKLIEYKHTMGQIANQYGVDVCTIERINNGTIRNDIKINYPIRDMKCCEKIALNIISDLINTNLKIKDIALKYNMNYQNISDINRGKTHKKLHNYDVPLRKNTIKRK